MADLHVTREARLSRRRLARQLAAAGFGSSVIGRTLAAEGWAREVLAWLKTDVHRVVELAPRQLPLASRDDDGPFHALNEAFLTPNDALYIRTSRSVPVLDPVAWRLRVTGAVHAPIDLSLDDLKRRGVVTRVAFLECSDNGHGQMDLAAPGSPSDNADIGNAAWTGTPLRVILNEAGLRANAVEIVSRSADSVEMQRSLPLGKALAPETMVVWEMNGEALPVAHGGPVRLLVPGWGAAASTKWLTGIEVVDHAVREHVPLDGCIVADAFDRRLKPVREMPVKAVIIAPVAGSEVDAGAQVITGFAWSGYGKVTRVAFSTDGGNEWGEAEIVEQAGRHAWVKFEAPWDARPGRVSLCARATDELMMTQPWAMPWNARGYCYNAVSEVSVRVV